MKILPWVLNAVVTGAGHEFNVGLIVPDNGGAQRVAEEMDLSVDPQAILTRQVPQAGTRGSADH